MISPELHEALEPVLRVLRSLGVRHYVGGSLASSAHGVARSSLDADVVAELRPEHESAFVAALGTAYYVPEARVTDAIQRRGSFNLIHLDTVFKVDVFVSKDRPFDRRAMERARPAAGGSGQPGKAFDLPVASAEDTVLAKLEWYERGGRTSERQWGDVLGVLLASAGSLDEVYLRSGAEELGVSELLARALREAGDQE